jgi:hypothetical protein
MSEQPPRVQTADTPEPMSAAPAPAVLVLTLPDGATREVAPGTLARDVVATIGPRLLLAAIAVSWTARCRTS